MIVSDLCAHLRALGADSTAVNSLEQLLAPVGELSVEALVAAIAPVVTKEAKKLQAKHQKASAAEGVIKRYVDELKAAANDNSVFEAVAKRIEKDRVIKIAEAREIVGRFMNEPSLHKTKKDALKALLQRQISDRRSATRRSQVPGLF